MTPEKSRKRGHSVANLARGFFDFLGDLAVALDSLPLEQKQPFKDFVVSVLSRTATDKKSVEYWTKDDKELARLLSGRAWWVLQKDINGQAKRDLLRLGREGKSDQVDDYVCSLFRGGRLINLQTKVDGWSEVRYIGERKRIVSDCLEAHGEGKYTLTVPTLLPLIDGLTRRFRKDNVRPRQRQNDRGVLKVNQFANHYRRKEHKLWGTTFQQFIQKIAFVHFDFESGSPAHSFNRHGILHGEIPDYASEANSLRAFLTLDTIARFVLTVERRSR